VHKLSAHACSSICAFDWAAISSPVEAVLNDFFPHDTSGGAASANTVRGCSGSTVGPSGSHYNIGPLQKASGPKKKEKTAMSHVWDTHHEGLQRQSSCAHLSCDVGCLKSCFSHRGLHMVIFLVFIGMVRLPKMRHARFLTD